MTIDTQVLSDLTAVLADQFEPEMTRLWNRSTVLLSQLDIKPGRGETVTWAAQVGRATAPGAITEGADVADAEYQHDINVTASLSWGLYRTAFSISGPAMAAARSSIGSPTAMMEIFGDAMQGGISSLAASLNAAAYTGDGSSGELCGLDNALLASGTYANVAIGTYASWASNVLANGGTDRALTVDLLDQAEAAVYEDSGMVPDLIVASPAVVRQYGKLLNENVSTSPGGGEASGGAALRESPGYTGYTYRGIPILRDRNAGDKVYMINRSFTDVVYLPHVLPSDPESTSVAQMSLAGGVPVKIEPVAKTGDAYKFSLTTYLQMRARRPNACAVITDIAV